MSRNKYVSWVISLLAIIGFFLYLDCSPKKVVAPSIAPRVQGTAPVLAKAAWEAEWAKITAEAKKEGRLIVYITTPGPTTSNFLKKSMKDKFGVDMELSAMPSVAAQEKILRETKADIFNIDINMIGMGPTFLFYEKMELLEPLDKVIFLPEVTDNKLWMDSSLFLDRAHTAAGGFAGVNPLVTINTQLVRPGEIRSLTDLLDPRWKGKIVLHDPTITGTGNGTMKTIFIFKGEDFIKNLAEQNPTIIRDARLQIEWLAKGKFAVSLGPSFGIIKDFMDTGSPISYVLPAEGALMSTSPGVVTLLKNAPHPNAAKLFSNWILTREAQTEFSRAQDTASRRLDISTEHLAPERQPRKEVRYFKDTDEDFWKKHEDLLNKFKEILRPLM